MSAASKELQRLIERIAREVRDEGFSQHGVAPGVRIVTGAGGGVTDHGALTGLGDDHHPQYLLTSGGRPLSGPWDVGAVRLRNLQDPALAQDAATKAYVDSTSAGSGDVATDTIWDAKGDLAVASGADAASRLGVGSNGQVLTADNTMPLGVKWDTPTGGTGGGWAPLVSPLSKPVLSDYTWVNQGTAAATDLSNALLLEQSAVSGNNYRMLVRAAPATPWTLTIAFQPHTARQSGNAHGLVLRESSTGKFIAMHMIIAALSVTYYDNPTTTNTTPISGSVGVNYLQGPLWWFRVNDDGTNLAFRVSGNGVVWAQIGSFGRALHLASGPDQIGLGVQSANATWGVSSATYHWAVS
jgi:hypothetical protein